MLKCIGKSNQFGLHATRKCRHFLHTFAHKARKFCTHSANAELLVHCKNLLLVGPLFSRLGDFYQSRTFIFAERGQTAKIKVLEKKGFTTYITYMGNFPMLRVIG